MRESRSSKTKPGVRLPDVTAGENTDDVSLGPSAWPPAYTIIYAGRLLAIFTRPLKGIIAQE